MRSWYIDIVKASDAHKTKQPAPKNSFVMDRRVDLPPGRWCINVLNPLAVDTSPYSGTVGTICVAKTTNPTKQNGEADAPVRAHASVKVRE